MRKNLKELRIERNLTQMEVANSLDIAKSTYCDIENHKQHPSLQLATKISQYFSVPTEILFGKIDFSLLKPEKKLYDVDEFRSEILNNKISKSTVYAKIKSGEIKAIKIGKRPFIPAWYIEELLTSRNI